MAVPLADAAPGTLAQVFGAALTERDAQLRTLKQGWTEKADNLLGWIEAQLEHHRSSWDGRKLSYKKCAEWLAVLEQCKSWSHHAAVWSAQRVEQCRHRDVGSVFGARAKAPTRKVEQFVDAAVWQGEQS
jgi:hypothetical protein